MENVCQNITVADSELFIALNATFCVIGVLFCLVTIVLIISLKIYRQHIHRLQLYIAIFCSLFNAFLALEVIPVDTSGTCVKVKTGWNKACVALGFIAQYFGIAKSFSMLWVCWYVFMLAIFKWQIKKEIAGIVLVLIVPAFFAWIPFLHTTYGLNGVWCWIKDENSGNYSPFSGTIQSGLVAGADFFIHLVSTVMIVVVGLTFCKGAFTHKSILKHQHLLALKEVLPLLVYPTVDCFGVILIAGKTVYFIATSQYSRDSIQIQMVSIAALQMSTVVLPLSLLFHPSVRSLACPHKQRSTRVLDNSDHSLSSTEYSASSTVNATRSLLSGTLTK